MLYRVRFLIVQALRLSNTGAHGNLWAPIPPWHRPKCNTLLYSIRVHVERLANITTFYNGQQLVLCNWDNNGTNAFANSVLALSFGMWATQINPRLAAYPDDSQWAHNTQDWAPVDLPTEGGQWTLTTTGAPTITLMPIDWILHVRVV